MTDRGNLVRGGNDTIKPCLLRELSQRNRARAKRSRQADAAQGGCIEARQYCDSEQCRPTLLSRDRFACGAHHRESPRGVERQEANIGKRSGGRYSSGHGIWDIVEFQVEENFGACGCEHSNRARAFGREELASDFEQVGDTLKPPGQSQGWPQAVNIQRDD
jgi:hypothetical protein